VARRASPKYKARKTTVAGITFDSAKEAARYLQLAMMAEAGAIVELKVHPVFKLTAGGRPVMYSPRTKLGKRRQASYEADFSYRYAGSWERIVEDVKGFDTQLSRLKRAMLEAEFGITVQIV